jgi:hypothetical protein
MWNMGCPKRRVCILAAILMTSSVVCLAQDPDEGVRRRLKEMKGNNDQGAQVAEMELAAMGEKAVGPLKKIIDDEKDSERAEAMKAYPRALEKAGLLTLVSLDFDNAKFTDVIAELNKQCKTRVIDVANSAINTKITIHREKVPYCRALAEICQRVDGTLNIDYPPPKEIIVREAGTRNRPISEDWGNVVILDGSNWRSMVTYDDMTRTGPNLELNLKLILDPAIQAIGVGEFRDVQATNDLGKTLKPYPSGTPFYDANSWSMVKSGALTFRDPEGSKKIASLKGKTMQWIGYDLETWEIDDAKKAQGSSHDFGTIKLTFKSMEINAGNLIVIAAMSGVPKPPGFAIGVREYRQIFSSLIKNGFKCAYEGGDSSLYLNSVSFNEIQPMEGGLFYQGEGTFKLMYPMKKADEKVKLTFSLPRKFEELGVGFEFKDIDLF